MIDLLLVEDDIDLQKVLAQYLELSGFNVFTANHGKHGLKVFREHHVDLCILDIMMPVMDGFALAGEIRKLDPAMPVVFLTARNQKEDRLRGLKIGADDYITKPFSIEELLFRVNIFLKRRKILSDHSTTFTKVGHFRFEYRNLSLISTANTRVLTQKEADLFRFLLMQQNQVCKRSDILQEIWGEDDYFMGRSLDVFISKLRKYLASDESVQIENIHGVGFKLSVQT